MQVSAGGSDFAYSLNLTAEGPLVLHGDAGYSVKSAAGQASRYYSQPALTAEGWIETATGRIAVTGDAWLDREWSSQPLAADQTGWDWFSLTFDDGAKLMAYRLRGAEVYTAATWIGADGRAEPLPDGAFAAEPAGLERGRGTYLAAALADRAAGKSPDGRGGGDLPGRLDADAVSLLGGAGDRHRLASGSGVSGDDRVRLSRSAIVIVLTWPGAQVAGWRRICRRPSLRPRFACPAFRPSRWRRSARCASRFKTHRWGLVTPGTSL